MKRNETILSVLVAAALSLPCVVFAAGTQVPGSTDEARYAAQRATSESTPAYSDSARSATTTQAGSTDEARALAGQGRAPTHVVLPSNCTLPTNAAASTDEARWSFGRYLEACSQQA